MHSVVHVYMVESDTRGGSPDMQLQLMLMHA